LRIEGGGDHGTQPGGSDRQRNSPETPDAPDWVGRYEARLFERHRAWGRKEDAGQMRLVKERPLRGKWVEGVFLRDTRVAFDVRHFDRGPGQHGLAELRLRLLLEPDDYVTPAEANAVRQQALPGEEKSSTGQGTSRVMISSDSLLSSLTTPRPPMPPFCCIPISGEPPVRNGTWGSPPERQRIVTTGRRFASTSFSTFSAYSMIILLETKACGPGPFARWRGMIRISSPDYGTTAL
jgi:hypothetical protein